MPASDVSSSASQQNQAATESAADPTGAISVGGDTVSTPASPSYAILPPSPINVDLTSMPVQIGSRGVPLATATTEYAADVSLGQVAASADMNLPG